MESSDSIQTNDNNIKQNSEEEEVKQNDSLEINDGYNSSKKRSKTGCFTCRFIKRKCDEEKIEGKCKSCYTSYLDCFWPDNYGDNSGALTKELRQLISSKLQEGKEEAKRKRREQKKILLEQKALERKKQKELEKLEKKKNKVAKPKKTKKTTKSKKIVTENNIDLEPAKALLEMSASFITSPVPINNNGTINPLNSKMSPLINSVKETMQTDDQTQMNLNEPYSLKKKNLSNTLFNFGNINDTSIFLDKMFDIGVQNETMLTAYLNTNKQEHSDKQDNVIINGMTPSESLPAFSPLFLGNGNGVLSPLSTQSPLTNNDLVLNPNHFRLITIEENEVLQNEMKQPVATANSPEQQAGLADQQDEGQYGGLDEELSENETIYRQLLARFEKRDIHKDFELIMHQKRNPASRAGSVHSSAMSSNLTTATGSTKPTSENELLLYYTFFNYFLPQVGPQNTLPQLSTSVTFPQVEHNGIVRSVFKCCGATFLAWCQPDEYSKIAEDLYNESKKNLQKVLGERKYLYDISTATEANSPESASSNNSMGLNYKEIKGDEDWIIACFQLLVLRDKLKNGQDVVDRCLENLAHSFETIQNRYLLDTSSEIPNTPVDRMLLESFVYNYTVSISVARDFDSKALPNPFDPIITRLVSMLKFPIFENCEVEWLNNPVLGSSVECFIMLAKVSYLGRLKLPLTADSIWEIRAKELQQQCLYYSPPALPEKIKNNMAKYSKYRPGLLSGSIVSKACYLLLFKILNFSTMTDEEILKDEDIQNVVRYIITALNDIEMGDKLLCILQWALLIIGAFTVTDNDRFVIKKYVRSVGETIHSHCGNQIKIILDEIWETGNLGILFDIEQISKLVI